MSRTWFTSDTHFGHENIIRYCQRLFRDAREMDAVMVVNWKAIVQPDCGTVWKTGSDLVLLKFAFLVSK